MFIDVEIKDNEYCYKFTVKSKYTVLTGDSSTGKTKLCELISKLSEDDHPLLKNNQGYIPLLHSNLYRTLYNLSDYVDFVEIIEQSNNKIFIIDETSKILKYEDVYDKINKSNNYFILVTRDYVPKSIAVGVYDVYQLRFIKKNKAIVYNIFEPLLSLDLVDSSFKPDLILTEDSGSGLDMYNLLFDTNVVDVDTSNGNSNVINYLNALKSIRVLLFVDFSAFGPFVRVVEKLGKLLDLDIKYFYAESFEHILLRSNVFGYKFINDLSLHFDNLNLSKHSSYEQYFEDLVVKITKDLEYIEVYTKKNLIDYLTRSNSIEMLKNDLVTNGVTKSILRKSDSDKTPLNKLKEMSEV